MAVDRQELESRVKRLESRLTPQSPLVTVDALRTEVARRETAILRTEAERLLNELPERRSMKQPLTEDEGQVLREAQATGVLPQNLPPTRVDVIRGARVITETFAGRNCEGDVWQQFAYPNLTIGKFVRPAASALAAAKGWWRP